MPNPADPQSFNRYSYCINNPLKYIDASGHVYFADCEGMPAAEEEYTTLPPIQSGGIGTGFSDIPDNPSAPEPGFDGVTGEYTGTGYYIPPVESSQMPMTSDQPSGGGGSTSWDAEPEPAEPHGASIVAEATTGATVSTSLAKGISGTIMKGIGLLASIITMILIPTDSPLKTNPLNISYPGNDATKAPEGYEWKGQPGSMPGSSEGSYYKPETGEVLRPNLLHPEPIGPHWDYRDPKGDWWRNYPNNIIESKP